MNNSSLVFIESNTSGTGRFFARTALAQGHCPLLIAETPERYPFIHDDGIEHRCANTRSFEDLCHIIEQIAADSPIAGIFSSSEYFLQTAAELASRYGLPGNSPSSLKNCRNKWTQRKCFLSRGIPVPQFRCVGSLDEVRTIAGIFSLPVVVKPTMGSGSVGVRLCSSMDEVMEHTARLLTTKVNERELPNPAEVLIEEYLDGPEFSVEIFNGAVIGITRKHVSMPPFFVELGHNFPASLLADLSESVSSCARHGVEALGVTWGPVHVELRVTKNGPFIVEVNPRLAGGFIPELVRLAFGIDLISATLALVVGSRPDLQQRCSQYVAIRFLTCLREGLMTSVAGIEEGSAMPGIVDIQIYRRTGDRILTENDFRDRLGHVIACGDSEVDAARRAERARDAIEIRVKADS